jgi:hypothetical protein
MCVVPLFPIVNLSERVCFCKSIYLSIYLSVRSRFYERKLSPCRAAAAAPRRETD